jgi:hypothetical protein
VVKRLPSKCEALSSNPSTAKIKQQKKEARPGDSCPGWVSVVLHAHWGQQGGFCSLKHCLFLVVSHGPALQIPTTQQHGVRTELVVHTLSHGTIRAWKN